MIDAVRTMALDYLAGELAGEELPADVENWYQNLRRSSSGSMFPYLVEDSGKIGTVYILEKCADDLVQLLVQDIVDDAGSAGKGCTPDKLPFMRPSGSQSAQVGPVFKRTYDKKKGGGPSEKILVTTINYFTEVAKADQPWSPYFQDIIDILGCARIQLPGGDVLDWEKSKYANMPLNYGRKLLLNPACLRR